MENTIKDTEIISKEKAYWRNIIKKTNDLIVEGERNIKINKVILEFAKNEDKNAP